MIKVTIETDDPTSEAYRKILDILGMADEVQLEDPLFPNHIVSSRWYVENWHISIPYVNCTVDSGLTPRVIRDLLHNKPRRDLPDELSSMINWESILQQIENIEMERATKARLQAARA